LATEPCLELADFGSFIQYAIGWASEERRWLKQRGRSCCYGRCQLWLCPFLRGHGLPRHAVLPSRAPVETGTPPGKHIL
jgi:hypothetical protein